MSNIMYKSSASRDCIFSTGHPSWKVVEELQRAVAANPEGVAVGTDPNLDYLWSQQARSRSTRYPQISRWQFGADSSLILLFTAFCVEARGDGPFVL